MQIEATPAFKRKLAEFYPAVSFDEAPVVDEALVSFIALGRYFSEAGGLQEAAWIEGDPEGPWEFDRIPAPFRYVAYRKWLGDGDESLVLFMLLEDISQDLRCIRVDSSQVEENSSLEHPELNKPCSFHGCRHVIPITPEEAANLGHIARWYCERYSAMRERLEQLDTEEHAHCCLAHVAPHEWLHEGPPCDASYECPCPAFDTDEFRKRRR